MIYPVDPDNAIEERVELLLTRPDRRSIDALKDLPLVWLGVTAITSFLIWLHWTFATVRQRSAVFVDELDAHTTQNVLTLQRKLGSFCQNQLCGLSHLRHAEYQRRRS
jgi:hypothetical protein